MESDYSSESETEKISWVIHLNEQISPHQNKEDPWKKHSIYKVPAYIKNLNSKAYIPQVVSIGPYHRGQPHLETMEQHKRRALAHFIKRSRKPIEKFAAAIEKKVGDLMDSYEKLDDEWKDRGNFLNLMLIDGCFLLELLLIQAEKKIPDDYEKDDPIFSLRGVLNTFSYWMPDLLMVENQVPLLLLETLLSVGNTTRNEEQNENYTKELVCKSFWHAESTAPQMDPGLHLLDVFRKAIVRDLYRGSTQDLIDPGLPAVAVKPATELRDAGIAFVQPDRRGIAFENGVLYLPTLHVERTTEVVYLNMIAFERLCPYASLKVSSYIAFMSGLVSSVKDVAWLRSEKLIETTLVDDEDVARLMNELSKDVCYDPYSSLCKVRDSLNWQYELGMRKWSRRLREWRKNLKETYFKNPWTFISLIAAVVLLSLTVVQTYYTVLPKSKNE